MGSPFYQQNLNMADQIKVSWPFYQQNLTMPDQT